MRLVVGLLQPLGAHVRIDLGGDQMRMAQQFLDAAQIRPGIEQVRRVAVPDLVWRQVRIQPRHFEMPLQPQLNQAGYIGVCFFSSAQKTGEIAAGGESSDFQ